MINSPHLTFVATTQEVFLQMTLSPRNYCPTTSAQTLPLCISSVPHDFIINSFAFLLIPHAGLSEFWG